jgi:hypothetical protein
MITKIFKEVFKEFVKLVAAKENISIDDEKIEKIFKEWGGEDLELIGDKQFYYLEGFGEEEIREHFNDEFFDEVYLTCEEAVKYLKEK